MNRSNFLPVRDLRLMAALLPLTLILSGCASTQKEPVLYPNSHTRVVGKVQAQRDIDNCMTLATDYGVRDRGYEVIGWE